MMQDSCMLPRPLSELAIRGIQVLVGTGGWSYLPLGSKDKLKEYSRLFSFVEANSTFYRYPSMRSVRSWKARVKKDFLFSVKCHRDVTHGHMLSPVQPVFMALERMYEVCKTLDTDLLILQTPPWMSQKLSARDLRNTLSTAPDGLRFIWEARQFRSAELPSELQKVMSDLQVVQAVDLSSEEAPEQQDLLYSRIFGESGGSIYPLSQPELDTIIRRVSRSGARRAILSFHGFTMYQDAITFRQRAQSSLGG